jgi:predicted lipid-binding transport protein (Tim44 family)
VEDRSTAAVITGSKTKATSFTERWKLALNGSDTNPWKIVSAQSG